MTGTILGNFLVAVGTQIARLRNTILARDLRAMLGVTGDAMQCIDMLQPVRVARVPEFTYRMRIKRLFAIVTVASDTGLLQYFSTAKWITVAGRACQLQLVMPRCQFTGHKNAFVCRFDQHGVRHPGKQANGRQQPDNPQYASLLSISHS